MPLVTSPAFTRRAFAEIAVAHMDPALDPEKQFTHGHKPAGVAALAVFSTRLYGGPFTPRIIKDTGRSWRRAFGIKKRFIGGLSVWQSARRPRSAGYMRSALRRAELSLWLSQYRPKA
jgi:hypothetical protein